MDCYQVEVRLALVRASRLLSDLPALQVFH
jgi:hypothetical protein